MHHPRQIASNRQHSSLALGSYRLAYTTLELITSLVSASVLLTGLSTAIVISGHALTLSPIESEKTILPGTGLASWREDVADATALNAMQSNSVEIVVPDRDGDNVDETIQYALDGTTLTRTENGGVARSIATNVQSLQMAATTEQAVAGGTPFSDRSGQITIQSRRRKEFTTPTSTVDLDLPPGSQPGELVLFAVATDGNMTTSVSVAEAGWTLVSSSHYSSTISIAVWSRILDGTESNTQTVNWTGNMHAVAWMMRFTGTSDYPVSSHDSKSGWIDGYWYYWGVSVPELYVSSPNSVALQFVVVEGAQFYRHSPQLAGYINEFTDYVPNTSPTMQAMCCYKYMGDSNETDTDNRLGFVTSGAYGIITVALQANADEE